MSEEHDEYCWLTGARALEMLVDDDATTAWTRRLIQKAEAIRPHLADSLLAFNCNEGFAFN
jgi:hypothetical protein